jgi:RNA polymerase sigma-70 factor (ECF subfamily)
MENNIENSELENIEKLFKENYKSLCNVVFRIINDWDASEDVVQEMFLKLWKKKKDIKIESSLKGYLFKAASNSAINYLQSQRKLKIKEELTEQINNSQIIEESLNYDGRELQIRIEVALNKLPPKCKVIFLLSRQEGMKYQEIADELDISIKTVENQMGIALKKMKEELAPYLTKEFLVWPLLFLLGSLMS